MHVSLVEHRDNLGQQGNLVDRGLAGGRAHGVVVALGGRLHLLLQLDHLLGQRLSRPHDLATPRLELRQHRLYVILPARLHRLGGATAARPLALAVVVVAVRRRRPLHALLGEPAVHHALRALVSLAGGRRGVGGAAGPLVRLLEPLARRAVRLALVLLGRRLALAQHALHLLALGVRERRQIVVVAVRVGVVAKDGGVERPLL
mmetsp:Transcript_4816/g.15548  ORF Transcript_4816/g.15548 Transcript_4816/m.15548 type:complete len:204 (-) Transcript_4816:133-744(-)